MIKLYIQKQDQKRFKDIFQFLVKNNGKAFISQQGIDFTHTHGKGNITKEAFINYSVQGSKRLTILDNKEALKHWLSNWNAEHKNFQSFMGRYVETIEISV